MIYAHVKKCTSTENILIFWIVDIKKILKVARSFSANYTKSLARKYFHRYEYFRCGNMSWQFKLIASSNVSDTFTFPEIPGIEPHAHTHTHRIHAHLGPAWKKQNDKRKIKLRKCVKLTWSENALSYRTVRMWFARFRIKKFHLEKHEYE